MVLVTGNISAEQPGQSGPRCVAQRREVKNIMLVLSPCDHSRLTRGGKRVVFLDDTWFFTAQSLEANSWDWTHFKSSVFTQCPHPFPAASACLALKLSVHFTRRTRNLRPCEQSVPPAAQVGFSCDRFNLNNQEQLKKISYHIKPPLILLQQLCPVPSWADRSQSFESCMRSFWSHLIQNMLDWNLGNLEAVLTL